MSLRDLFRYDAVLRTAPGWRGWLGRENGPPRPSWRDPSKQVRITVPWPIVARWTWHRAFGLWCAMPCSWEQGPGSRLFLAVEGGRRRELRRFGYSHPDPDRACSVYVLRPFHLLTRALAWWRGARWCIERRLIDAGLMQTPREGCYFHEAWLPDTPSRPEDRRPFFWLTPERSR